MIGVKARRAQLVSILAGFFILGVRLPAQFALVGSAYPGDNSDPATLYALSTGNAAATSIGSVGFAQVGAIDYDPVTGFLYGVGRNGSSNTVLVKINPGTGLGTQVGLLGVDDNFSDISFRSDGTLFAFDAYSKSVYTINSSNGLATLLASGVIASEITSNGNAIAFSPPGTPLPGTLYFANNTFLGTIDTSTGVVTSVTTLDYSLVSGTGDRANGMDFDPVSGILYASVNSSTGSHLATINTTNGVVIEIGPMADSFDAIAFVPIPEPAGLALMTGLASLCVGGWIRGRRASIR